MKSAIQPRTLLALASFLVVLGAKWTLIRTHGVNVPYLDQWDAEVPLYQAIHDDRFPLDRLFAAHNEHRIVTTRLWSLGLFVLNANTWDVRLQMTANATLHAAFLALLCLWLTLDRPWPIALWVHGLGTLAGCLPTGWINTLGGFQAQAYFALLFQVVALRLLVLRVPASRGWWMGVLAALAAGGSMASGLFAAPAAGVVMALHVRGQPAQRRQRLGGVLLLFTLFALGVWATPRLPDTAALRPTSVHAILAAAIRTFSWPLASPAGIGLLLWLPFVPAVLRRLRGRPASESVGDFGLAVGIAAILTGLATTLGRGAASPGAGILPHYTDNLIPGILAAAALIPCPFAASGRPLIAALLPMWTLLLAAGLFQQGTQPNGWRLGPEYRRRQALLMAESLRGYYRTGDPYWLGNQRPVPYLGNPGRMRTLADDPAVAHVLPPGLRPPVLPRSIRLSGAAFTNQADRTDLAVAEWVSGIGLAGPAGEGSLDADFDVPGHRWIEFDVDAHPGARGARIAVVEPDRVHELVVPGRESGKRRLRLRHPGFRLQVRHTAEVADGFVIYSGPRPVGPLSPASEWLLEHGRQAMLLGAGLCLAALGTARARGASARPRAAVDHTPAS